MRRPARLRRGWMVLLALVVFGAIGTNGHATTTTPTPPPWGYDVPFPYATLGQNLSVLIWGPYGGIVNVSVFVQPFNSTPPVFVHDYNLTTGYGSVATETNTTVYKNVSVPMARLYAGTVEVCFVAGTGTALGCSFVQLAAFDLSTIENWMALEYENITILQGREQAQFYNQNNLAGQIDLEFWFSVFIWIILMAAVVFTRTRFAERRFGRWLRESAHNFFYRPPHVVFGTGIEPTAPKRPPRDPDKVFRGIGYPKCAECAIDHTEVGFVQHYVRDHEVIHPKEGRDYARYRPSVKAARRSAPDLEPSAKVLFAHLDDPSTNVDLSDLRGR